LVANRTVNAFAVHCTGRIKITTVPNQTEPNRTGIGLNHAFSSPIQCRFEHSSLTDDVIIRFPIEYSTSTDNIAVNSHLTINYCAFDKIYYVLLIIGWGLLFGPNGNNYDNVWRWCRRSSTTTVERWLPLFRSSHTLTATLCLRWCRSWSMRCFSRATISSERARSAPKCTSYRKASWILSPKRVTWRPVSQTDRISEVSKSRH